MESGLSDELTQCDKDDILVYAISYNLINNHRRRKPVKSSYELYCFCMSIYLLKSNRHSIKIYGINNRLY